MATLASEARFKTRVTTLLERDSLTVFLQGTTLYLLCFAILALIMFATPAFFSTDDYYHARISEQIIKQGRLGLDFPWLPRTILSPDKYVDHHLLYHIALAPAVYFFNMTGAKVVTVAIAAGIFLAAWVMFRQIGVRYPTIWTMMMFGVSATFLFRMLMIRTQGFSFLLLALALIVMFQKRYRWLLLLGFLYVWLYNGFILMLVFAVVYAAARWAEDRSIAWEPVVYCGVGLVLGLVINPYFPRNIQFVIDHLGAKVDLDSSITLGNEWDPFNTRTWLTALTGSVAAMLFGFIKPVFGAKRDHIETTLLGTALVTGFMSFQSMRFLEYFPGFALMFCAAAWGRDPVIVLDWAPYRRFARYVVPVVLLGFMIYFSGTILTSTYGLAQRARDVRDYAGASRWIAANTDENTMIYAVGFNDFSRLFFHNQRNTYLIGLDPTYLSYADPHLWDEYDDIRSGRVEFPSQRIASEFGLQYVVSGERHQAFNRLSQADPGFDLVYRDQFNFVFRVKDEVLAQYGIEGDGRM